MKPIIVAKDLHKRYAGFAPVLRGVNLEVYPGELVAIMGPSGCGKSTMLHILGLLHSPDSGTLTIMDKNVLAFNREQTAAFRAGVRTGWIVSLIDKYFNCHKISPFLIILFGEMRDCEE